MNSIEIRNKFLNYFAKNGHKIVQSDSLIPSGDPTLLFTSAGMVQFKKHFLGQSKDTFTRAATSQKCFRTSDIDQVGKTNRHLTFFEMLGNFSFGDYFKNDAIAWGWDFLTKEMLLPIDKMYVTVYKDDDEAYAIWKKIVPESRIIRMGDETNFWNMGPTGPCGPCSEILVDLGPEMSCGKPDCGPACSCNRYLEVWNLVFTQFDKQEDGSLKNLPKKNIDTGMGLERLTAVANGKKNVFETDLFMPVMSSVADLMNMDLSKNLPEFRMIADHVRAITFLIADGILPSNEGRGYVLRRILRRALRQGKIFGINEPFLYKVTANIADIMKSAYPELMERRENIASITKMEEEKFLETLESGTRILEELISHYNSKNNQASKSIISGNDVFKLYDTYGFPPDLTNEIAKEHGLLIDEAGFAAAQKQAQEKSRAAWSGSGEKDITLYSTIHKKCGDTKFAAYEKFTVQTKIVEILKNGESVKTINPGEEAEIILEETPFYAESGGQVGDQGIIKNNSTIVAEVIDTQKPVNGLIIHKVKVKHETLSVQQKIEANVDVERRKAIMRHHTATHLLHKALRQEVGSHVAQAGSLVTPDNFRFDFTHLAALKPEEIKAVEDIVNEAIRSNMPVTVKTMKLDEARKLGAIALFGEKYGDTVRAVIIQEDSQPVYSMELCGGTHVSRTGDIGIFKIISESSVAAGTRRIEAVAGRAGEKYLNLMENTIDEISNKIKSSRSDICMRIDKMIAQQKEMEKEISRLKLQIASSGSSEMLKNIHEVNGMKILTAKVADVDNKSLRDLTDNLKSKLVSGIVIIVNTENDKFSYIISVTEDLVKNGVHAGKIAKGFSSLIEGSGGGRADFAQGGGKDAAKIDRAFEKIQDII